MKKFFVLVVVLAGGLGYFLLRDYNSFYIKVSDNTNNVITNVSRETKIQKMLEKKKQFSDFINEYKAIHTDGYEPDKFNPTKKNVSIVLIQKDSSDRAVKTALELPSHITLAFNPQINNKTLVATRKAHHEILLIIPMEPVNFPDTNPGPLTLLTGLTLDENMKNLDVLLDMSMPIFSIGFINVDGGRFSVSQNDFLPVLEKLSREKFFFINAASFDNATTDGILEASSAITDNFTTLLPYDYMSEERLKDFFDNIDSSIKIEDKNLHLVVLYSSDQSIKALKKWMDVHEKDYNFITVSNYLFNKERLKYEKKLTDKQVDKEVKTTKTDDNADTK